MQISSAALFASSIAAQGLCSLASTLDDEARTQLPFLRNSDDLQAVERQLNTAVLQVSRQMEKLSIKQKKYQNLSEVQTTLRDKLEIQYDLLKQRLEDIEEKINANQQALNLEKQHWTEAHKFIRAYPQGESEALKIGP